MSCVNEVIKLKGELVITKTTSDGKQEVITVPNLVVTAGKAFITSRMASNTAAVMSHMAVGTGNVVATSGDTGLGTEIARVALTVAGGTPSSNTITYSASFPAGTGTGTLTEAGIFNTSGAATGTMLCRTVYPAVAKGVSDVVGVSWIVSVT